MQKDYLFVGTENIEKETYIIGRDIPNSWKSCFRKNDEVRIEDSFFLKTTVEKALINLIEARATIDSDEFDVEATELMNYLYSKDVNAEVSVFFGTYLTVNIDLFKKDINAGVITLGKSVYDLN